jgi:hypothetical protein
VSKKHGHRKKHRRKARKGTVCPRCHTPSDGSPAALLGSLAAALNACDDGKMAVKLRHGSVFTRQGYVLRLEDDRWAARTKTYTPFAPVAEADELDD